MLSMDRILAPSTLLALYRYQIAPVRGLYCRRTSAVDRFVPLNAQRSRVDVVLHFERFCRGRPQPSCSM